MRQEMARKPGQLNVNQARAIEALLSTPTVAAAARRCGLSERTVWRYLADDGFKNELRRRQGEAVAAATAALAGLTGEAVRVLADLLADPETPASVRARAALGWLAERRRAVEIDDLVGRIEVIEQRVFRHKLRRRPDEKRDQTN